MDFRLANPREERNFTRGPAYVGIMLGDRMLWEPEESPLARLWCLFAWLSWVARGSRVYTVTAVDRERGIVTFGAG